jgi:peptide chain release factor
MMKKDIQMVTPQKLQALEDKMKRLNIRPADIIEKFILSSGKGGQHANKTSTCVYLKHIPTGIEVKNSETRERELNRFLARRILADRIEEKLTGTSERMKEFDRIRKRKSKKRKRQGLGIRG